MNIMCDMSNVHLLHGRFADHAQQRAKQLSFSLRRLLAHKFQARLAGSWATNEAHMPRPVGNHIRSLSDVDVLIDDTPTAEESSTIVHGVLNLAWQHGVEVSKVSVRCQSEIDGFWNPCRVSTLAENKLESGRFLTFWTLIGAIEASSMSADSVGNNRDYVFMKFFFKLCRNVLLIRRCNPTSYRELTTEILAQLINHPSVSRAYAIKIGHDITLSSTDCDAMLSDLNWEQISDALIDTHSCALMADIRKDIRIWYRTGTPLHAEAYLAQIKAFEKFPDLLPACAKAVRDYELRSAIKAA